MKKPRDIETFIDNSPLPGINLLPEKFDKDMVIKKQEDHANREDPILR